MKNTHGGVLLLLNVTLFHWCFSRFSNCTNDTKSRNASHMIHTEAYLRPCQTFMMKLFCKHSWWRRTNVFANKLYHGCVTGSYILVKVFKNGLSKICGMSIIEYLDPYIFAIDKWFTIKWWNQFCCSCC